jgi:hypothetical protein
MSDQQIAANWSDPTQLIFGKSHVPGSIAGDVFEGLTAAPIPYTAPARDTVQAVQSAPLSVELGGPWGFYEQFRPAHSLKGLPVAAIPEIRITRGTTLQIPLELHNHTDAMQTISISVKSPDGWTTQSGTGTLSLEKQSDYHAAVTLLAPKTESSALQEIQCLAESGGHIIGTIKIKVQVTATGLPQ